MASAAEGPEGAEEAECVEEGELVEDMLNRVNVEESVIWENCAVRGRPNSRKTERVKKIKK